MNTAKSLGRWVNHFLGKAGLKLIRIEQSDPVPPWRVNVDVSSAFRSRLAASPLDADLHLDFANAAQANGSYYLAWAELQTALQLGLDKEKSAYLQELLNSQRPDVLNLDHNRYFRLKSLADAVNLMARGRRLDVLDVGGGAGMLAEFLPEHGYCLAEPSVNGISGQSLPFSNQSFDVVVCCHVLEHIPMEERDSFLDELLRCTRFGLILLNPFHQEGTHVEERLRLVWDLTGSDWAREHFECALPSVESVVSFGRQRGLDVSVTPNGTLTTSFAMVFVDYFSAHAGQGSTAVRLNRFLNEKFQDLMDSKECPNGFLVCMTRIED